jgi:hypothetical protein
MNMTMNHRWELLICSLFKDAAAKLNYIVTYGPFIGNE